MHTGAANKNTSAREMVSRGKQQLAAAVGLQTAFCMTSRTSKLELTVGKHLQTCRTRTFTTSTHFAPGTTRRGKTAPRDGLFVRPFRVRTIVELSRPRVSRRTNGEMHETNERRVHVDDVSVRLTMTLCERDLFLFTAVLFPG